ncbi:glycosyltransferase [Microbacterium sp. MC2]
MSDMQKATDQRILFLSHSHVFGPFRVGSHHYARELARRGAEVVHLSTPISIAHRVTGRVPAPMSTTVPRGPHRDEQGVLHLVPRTALPRPYGRFRVARELAGHGIDPRFDAVLIDQPLLWDDSIRALAPRLIYRPTDLYPDGVKARLQKSILAAADGVVATSTEVLAALSAADLPSVVLGNGADVERFRSTDREPRPAVCVYVGALDRRFDWPQVVAWARSHPDVKFLIAGPEGEHPALPSNISLLGPIPYDEVPALLHRARVGLLPFSDDPLNTGRSPMKLHEYLAAGLTVVATETPVIRADEPAGVFTYTDRGDAETALGRALRAPSPNTAGAHRAAGEGWQVKTDALAAFIARL